MDVDGKLSVQKLLNGIMCFVEFYSNNCLFKINVPCKYLYFVILMLIAAFFLCLRINNSCCNVKIYLGT